MEGVEIWAPGPLSGRSPRLLTGSAFALDSLADAGPSLGTAEVVGGENLYSTVSAPGVLIGHSIFAPGGSEGW